MSIKRKNLVRKRGVALLLGICLLLSQLNLRSMLTYAEENTPEELQVGQQITASCEAGVLTLSGQGETYDFTAESAPFLAFAGEINSLKIEEGITYIGAYLFFGLGNLTGELILPASITGFGDYAFSGPEINSAPAFGIIQNSFSEGEQQINNPDTLFYQGQTGSVTVSETNLSFRNAAALAGYSVPDTPKADEAEAMVQNGDDLAAGEVYTDEPTPLTVNSNPIYVAGTNGDDTSGNGTVDHPYKTLAKAAEALPADGTMESNVIILSENYQLTATEKGKLLTKPATIRGLNKEIHLIGSFDAEGQDDATLELGAESCFDNLILNTITHIYSNGYDITLGENITVTNEKNVRLFLYCSGREKLLNERVANITVLSGEISRISGYVRSFNGILDVSGYPSSITVGGTAAVDTIIAGVASGGITNGDVTVNVQGGSVKKIIGGNQGFEANGSPYSGTTKINVSGGKVDRIYGAGSGRGSSIPTYKGVLDIKISGGTVGALYGSGSAAYIISDENTTSKVNIQITGGEVKNVYAAGRGLEESVSTVSGENSKLFGSLTGEAEITVTDGAAITGDIYASGQGDRSNVYDTKSNAFLKGNVSINVTGGTVKGSIYGGGAGIADSGYEECARVETDSQVNINVSGGTVEGSVYGGGKTAKVYSPTSVNISGGSILGSVYGGGEKGITENNTEVNISGSASIHQSVYGGAYGESGKIFVTGSSTVNMTDGTVGQNLYGGSMLGDNGQQNNTEDLIYVNLTGGRVEGNLFGGGYKGTVNGSTHLHIGKDALDKCKHYETYPKEKPNLSTAELYVGGSAYAGGDYGDGKAGYDTITITGTSHVYLDGTGYDTGSGNGVPALNLAGGVFGSGASCDAGSIRLVTVDNYGVETANGVSRALTAIQRADRVVMKDSHVQLTGQSDVANANKTTLYSLNRIGEKEKQEGLGELGNGLVLQGGSVLVLDAAVVEMANFKSVDSSGAAVDLNGLNSTPNKIFFSKGIVFRLSYTKDNKEIYGGVQGYTYMSASDTAVAYAYARINTDDGGFADLGGTEIGYTEIQTDYRYWRIAGANASATRDTVLTAQTLTSGDTGYGEDGYAVAAGSIELPPATSGSVYAIKSITLPSGVKLVDAAKTGTGGNWVTSEVNEAAGSGTVVDLSAQQSAISANALSTFGLYMDFMGEKASGRILSNESCKTDGANGVIGDSLAYSGAAVPKLNFYLTYYNDITVSRDLGTVRVEVTRTVDGAEQETTTMNVELVTRAGALQDQTVDIYATQSGTYTGKLLIPSGASRKLAMTGVTAGTASKLTEKKDKFGENEFALTMMPVASNAWNNTDLMKQPYDLKTFSGSSVAVGTTDSRYEAEIAFTMYHSSGFRAEGTDEEIVITFKDDSGSTGQEVKITLKVHWQKSIVTKTERASGKIYGGEIPGGTTVSISPESSLTARFALNTESTEQASDLWLELQKEDGTIYSMPSGTKLTIMYGNRFYIYQFAGNGAEDKIYLTQFTEMWKANSLNNISSGNMSVIVDFHGAETELVNGTYSLRLKSERGADSTGAAFEVGGAAVSITFTGVGGLSRGQHKFEVSINKAVDTRLTSGAAVVLSPSAGEFPEGTVFQYDDKTYYPINGSVYIPLKDAVSAEIIMNTEQSSGIGEGQHTLNARVYPVGIQAGGADGFDTAPADYTVTANPVYSLQVKLADGQSRMIKSGTEILLNASYAPATTVEDISVGIQKKSGESYEDVTNPAEWITSQVPGSSGEKTIKVKVPENTKSGTYRLNFVFAGQIVPYNIIVQ